MQECFFSGRVFFAEGLFRCDFFGYCATFFAAASERLETISGAPFSAVVPERRNVFFLVGHFWKPPLNEEMFFFWSPIFGKTL